jgi:alcohol dehydrogenase
VQVGLLVGENADPELPMSAVIERELTLVGSHGMASCDYPRLLDMVIAGQVQPQRLIHKRISLREAPQELAAMGRYDTLGITVIDLFAGC